MQPRTTVVLFKLAFQKLCATQNGKPLLSSMRCINEVFILRCSSSANLLDSKTRSSTGILWSDNSPLPISSFESRPSSSEIFSDTYVNSKAALHSYSTHGKDSEK